jgi:hypothetical protein
MTDEEFEIFLNSALDDLWEKQDMLETQYGFGTFSRWFFDQNTEKLELYNAYDIKVVEADVIDIGSYSTNGGTWKWAWSNESVLPNLRKKAEPLKELGEITGIELFNNEDTFSVESENMAWELAAMSVKQLNALGVYRAPSSSKPLCSFLALTSITRLQ